ncbi:MAG: hypothetical protein JWP91_1349 [Fibrobacteres bacterium]|nr:hypothetical protein [Fibrobacterota bacterium]
MNPFLFRSTFRVFTAKSPFLVAVPLAIASMCLLGCEDTRPRTYSEVAFKPLAAPAMAGGPMGAMGGPGGMGAGMPGMNTSPVDIKVTWKLPEGWVIKDSASAMRIGSFAAQDPSLANTGELDPNAVDVSVVQLAGDAGGLEANINRWMGQVGLKMNPEEMAEFIKAAAHFRTATGQEGMYVDLTDKLSGDMTQSKTIYGAVVQTADYTVFVKAMGEHAKVAVQKPMVQAFCKSLKIEGPKS